MGLLRRNAVDRMPFDQFFSHEFLQGPREIPNPTVPVELPASPINLAELRIANEATAAAVTAVTAAGVTNSGADTSSPCSSPEDDFVLVPSDLSSDTDNNPHQVKYTKQTSREAISPPRPCFLPISEPIPVPSQRSGSLTAEPSSPSLRACRTENSGNGGAGAGRGEGGGGGVIGGGSVVPRSQPISMRRSNDPYRNHGPNIGSLSPPSVQFVIGTPPGRRTSETPPPPNTWQVSPVARHSHASSGTSPLRRSTGGNNSASSPLLTGPLAVLGSPTSRALHENNNTLRHSPVIPFGTRAVTLPEISEATSFRDFFPELNPSSTHNTTMMDDRPLTFIAPELPEETLLEREHNEILAKLNFVVALCECVSEVARTRAGPLGAPLGAMEQAGNAATKRRAEQVILFVRALQWLSSGLSLATQQLEAGRLQPTASVKEGETSKIFPLESSTISTLFTNRKLPQNSFQSSAQ